MELRGQSLAFPLFGKVQLGGEPSQAVVGLRQGLRTFLHQLFQLAGEQPQPILAFPQGFFPLLCAR